MLPTALLQSTLAAALRTGGDFAEVFVEDRRTSAASLDDGKVEELSSGRARGAGIRVVVGQTTGFAHTADLSQVGMLAAAHAAAAAARSGGGGTVVADLGVRDVRNASTMGIDPASIGKADKVALLHKADAAGRAGRHAIKQVSASVADVRRRIQVANSDGLLASDDQVRTRFGVSAVASGDTGMQTGSQSRGATMGWELFDEIDIEELAHIAAEQAISKLAAQPAPSGPMPVILAAGGGGVLFHEACGHGLEADLIAKKMSVFAGRVGEKVASELVTLVDDGGVGGAWGTFGIDDEGAPAQRTTLIEDGVLTDYMWDLLRARKEGRTSTGNGRRETYKHLPMVRMTNTFLTPRGDTTLDDLIAGTARGVYCKQLSGGQVNTATGDFVFGMTEAYLIEDGKITAPLRSANLIGNGPRALGDIDGVANDFNMGSPGTCGKDGQGVPVGMGIPSVRVAQLTVGGTAS